MNTRATSNPLSPDIAVPIHEAAIPAAMAAEAAAPSPAAASVLVTLPMNMRVMRSGRWISVYLNSVLDDELIRSGLVTYPPCSVYYWRFRCKVATFLRRYF